MNRKEVGTAFKKEAKAVQEALEALGGNECDALQIRVRLAPARSKRRKGCGWCGGLAWGRRRQPCRASHVAICVHGMCACVCVWQDKLAASGEAPLKVGDATVTVTSTMVTITKEPTKVRPRPRL